ncbi:transcription-repair coupling factor [Lacticaseibacillus brantae]|uniref:Transcription-repair-coupling factor n=1 Tax=Lacticaseibacillus brantae DSM 23927 TaxID=1423727 RepID=A0A0R2AV30_9LACO|nr:transcription-repair coupling factor [Lacticaseibacillus brantae]KRM71240.1 transcription-repair coupling factor [Lacticaseibacillus brantae DSM 23927]
MDLITLMAQAPDLVDLWPKLNSGRHLITGLSGSARTLLLAALHQATDHQVLVVAHNRYQADELVADLTNLLGEAQVYNFPVEDVLAAEVAVSSPEAKNERINTLSWLLSGQSGVVVTSLAGYKRQLTPKAIFAQSNLTFDMNSEIDLAQLTQQLVAMGYVRQNLIDSPGQFAIRGGIIDIYPLNRDHPVRIELFDTDVDSLREFDLNTQRSLDNLDTVSIPPATDLIVTADALKAGGATLQAAATKQKAKAKSAEAKQALTNGVLAIAEQMQAGEVPEQLALYLPDIYPQATRLTDYLAPGATVVEDDYTRILDRDATSLQEMTDWFADLQKDGRLLPQTLLPVQDLDRQDEHGHVYLSLFQKGMGNLRLDTMTNVTSRNMQQFFSQMPLLKTEVDRWQKQGQTVVFLVNEAVRVTKLSQTLADFEIKSVQSKPDAILAGQVQVVPGTLQSGFELPAMKLVVVTEKELFNVQVKRKARHQTLANAERLRSYNELQPGDYVVHVNHGIGQYVGMETLLVDGVHQDYITIVYRDNGKLFIPVSQLNLVQKYVSADGKAPHLNKLGGAEWQKTKSRVAAKIEDIADDLIALYAEREAEQGFAFQPDDNYQKEFESEFPYPETPDQVRSVKEIKKDMERPRPMDRLLVGDVGFGKTEVALRAAFKAIESGKQVAFLVPTTILAKQHFDTMTERFADFPVNIGMLSRFQTTKQIKATLAGLKDGSVDIVVGTHRLLSKDVVYKDLGLLIVDEEQRFGVKHKERIKQLKSNVDVLTLTATPIPRTLNMSMLGVRDLSVIETPPTNRYPIQTFVMEQNAGAIRDAIEREMDRGGQVFYLHNRVEDIERTVDQIEQLVPNATVAYAHGQMTETQLEGVIYDFLQGRYDVLVTTTIIETGVDMPNVNTLIVEDADHYGLSQLYQLRGRIGRSSRVAYAYFMYKPAKVLNEVAEKRLQAIKDFTELGSGFKIAMRDLAIRGAGNLLGQQQHGFIDSVGYDLYTQMLQEAVAKKQGKQPKPQTDAEVDLDIEAYLPTDYISDSRQKVELYKQIRAVKTQVDEAELSADLIDRFGDYPQPVTNLLAVAHLKRFADQALVDKIRQLDRQIVITLSTKATGKVAGEAIFEVLSHTTLRAKVATVDSRLIVTLLLQPKMTPDDWLPELTNFLQALADTVNPVKESANAQ